MALPTTLFGIFRKFRKYFESYFFAFKGNGNSRKPCVDIPRGDSRLILSQSLSCVGFTTLDPYFEGVRRVQYHGLTLDHKFLM